MRLTPRVLLAASSITLALGNVGRIPSGAIGGRAAPIALNDLLLVPLWLILLAFVLPGKRRWVLDSTANWTLAFIAVAGVSALLAVPRYSLGMGAAFGVIAFLIRWVAYFGWFPLVVACLDDSDVLVAWRRFDIAILLIAVFGIFQFAFLPGFAQMIHTGGEGAPEWDPQGRRVVSTFLDPNFAGIVLCVALLMRLARVAEGLAIRAAPLIVLALALLLTVSRSSLLALAAGIGVIVMARGLSVRLLRVFLGGAIAGLPFITLFLAFASGFNKLRVDASAVQRLVPWMRALELMRDHPVFGVGFNAVAWAQRERGWRMIGGAGVSLDGGLLFVGAMTGIVGLIVFTAILVSVVKRARRLWRDYNVSAENRAFATGTAAVTVAVVLHSFFVNSLLLPFVMQLLWVLWGGVSVMRRTAQSAARAVSPTTTRALVTAPVLAAVVAVTSACAPCSGTSDCSTNPRVDVTGTIVEAVSGRAVSGSVVSATLPDGRSAESVTDKEGRWRIVIDDVPRDLKGASISVATGGTSSYTVNDLVLSPTSRSGDSHDVGRWMSHATARFQAAIFYRGTPLLGANVSFVPAAGVVARDLTGIGETNGAGIFELQIEGQGLVELKGTLNIQHQFVRNTTIQGFTIPLAYKWELPVPRGTIVVGGQISYGGLIRYRGTGERLSGIPVEFQQTSGVSVAEGVSRTVTGENGFFRIDFVPLVADIDPLANAEVVGDLVIKPPGQPETRHRGVRLPVYDSVAIRTLGSFSYGEAFNWTVELFDRGTQSLLPNATTEFRQTSGVPISPSVFQGRTGADGRFELRASVRDTGTVVGDLFVTLPGKASTKVRTLALRTNPDDSLRYAGMIAVGERWAWSLELWRHDRLAPAPGVDVEFRQTGGLAIAPAVIRGRTDAGGRVELRALVNDTGTVIGELLVMPAGEPSRIIPNIRLRTFDGDDLRFGGILGFGPALRYVGEVLQQNGAPVVGAQVEWTQTSGITATPTVLRVSTDAQGRFPLTLFPSIAGEVVGTVRVTPPAPWATSTVFTFTNLRLSTLENGNLVLAVTYRLPAP
ncbi:MAG: O-antigen ligase family protein [Phycisphaerae bacterium]|nr:O-antigen ligase family protein [Gemmatimonadaceae bacterium]